MILAIIPGNRGALAWLNNDGSIARTVGMPHTTITTPIRTQFQMNAADFVRLVSSEPIDRVVVERRAVVVDSSTTFSVGFTSGIVEGVLATLEIPRLSISHKQWQDDLSIPREYWGAVSRVNDLTARHWPKYRFDKSIGGHRKQQACLIGLYAIQMSHHDALVAA